MPQQARAHATRDAIIRGAGEVFGESTYASATLADVISRAGVTQGALYFHFGSKLELAQQVIRAQHETAMEAVERFGSATLPAIDSLVLLSGELARQITRDPVVRGGLRLTTESGQLFPEHATGPYLDWIASTEYFLRQAAEQGSVRPELDFPAVARYVISTFTGAQIVSRALTQLEDFDLRLEQMWRMQLPMLLRPELAHEAERLAALGGTVLR